MRHYSSCAREIAAELTLRAAEKMQTSFVGRKGENLSADSNFSSKYFVQ